MLTKNDGDAAWTISLNKNFEVHADDSLPQKGDITLYKAALGQQEPTVLHYVGG
ncbi:hypothetical protein P5G51_016610 [Virgibacillus sp. 179-BFC.A HS]|uniref:Uncharacterized protein n=1 Tax=Tigheibacillus jepli TaxID=3035914 RepID=A0ABU5CK72_9BACI|nr:hypothetical protein [Virgibacillus sp. 179-BFC.A HS]MDY0406762.1 hypothetical protein [Virgibacillus sp. 179-BFC.A HS]